MEVIAKSADGGEMTWKGSENHFAGISERLADRASESMMEVMGELVSVADGITLGINQAECALQALQAVRAVLVLANTSIKRMTPDNYVPE